jgi:uncharacterized membrane protein YesL
VVDANERVTIFSLLVGLFVGIGKIWLSNVIWIITSIPIVTILPSISALYSTIGRSLADGNTNFVRQYFREFKTLFWRSYVFGLPWIVVTYCLVVEARYYFNSSDTVVSNIMRGLVMAMMLVWWIISISLLPLITTNEVGLSGVYRFLYSYWSTQGPVRLLGVSIVWIITVLSILIMPGVLALGAVPVAFWLIHRTASMKANPS